MYFMEEKKEQEPVKEIPLNYQKPQSRVTGTLGYKQREFIDSRGQKYQRDEDGTVTKVKD
jgi:hypothetical protein